MNIQILIVDNRLDDPAVEKMQTWIAAHFPESYCKVTNKSRFDPGEVLLHKPDIVILDVALDPAEEEYFEKLGAEQTVFDVQKELSGIEYCRRLKASFAHLPVILVSQYFDPRILTQAIEAGADGFLYKRQLKEEHFVPAVEATFVRHKTHDIAFYTELRALLEDEERESYKREHMLRAMDAFFTHGSGTRRLTGLWCTLAELVEDVLPSETVNELLRALMDTEALLLAANPRMRDHVRHAGNVFWLGYYLLNSIEAVREPTQLPGAGEAGYAGSPLAPFEQVNLAWLLAALLHDIGYLTERLERVEERLGRGRSLFAVGPKKKANAMAIPAPQELDVLQPYLEKLGDKGSRLYSAIVHTIGLWGQPHPTDSEKTVSDHGIASASAFLTQVDRGRQNGTDRPEVLHAASAIALHNLAKWNTDWCEPGGVVGMPIHLLPAAWLLAYADELQGWGREPEGDPFNVEMAEKISDARRRYKEGYVMGSRMSAFDVNHSGKGVLNTCVKVDIQYMMVHGENADAVAADVRDGILKWRRERADSLRKTLGLDGLLETTITHRIPGPVGGDIVIKLHGGSDS